jgi:uncharacterized coiled-coil protein SlyX
MLLNEFLKEHQRAAEEHRIVEQQEATIAELKSSSAKQAATVEQQQKQIEALAATLQKVNDQVALTKPAPQLVANPLIASSLQNLNSANLEMVAPTRKSALVAPYCRV